ncbi:FAD-dependent oxidoreductase [Kibdelosporangium philippinense]|uniref:FAD-dependent oxidoreductase n=1 Tax=Kibdelosporangium philippinense TaxID=211113 RepID=A0ABS8Z8R8_9PSEU|nr:FAD-dependent oxidoreductase [Kibdelosporangium philippinense]MCE7002247.1 FAD-dependent oxidoreductase [Kibdelosporangium philippinense]
MLNDALSTRSQVVIVGGGIAGAWLAYRLAQREVRTVLIADDDRAQPLSRAAAGLIMQDAIHCTDRTAPSVFADSSTTQDPRYQARMIERARAEFDALARIVPYGPVGDFVCPLGPTPGIRLGAGDDVVRQVLARFEEHGGTRLRGRATDFVVTGGTCLGVRYEHEGQPGKVLAADVVLASGGFTGLFEDGLGSGTGYLLGTYARRGGCLANLELFNRFALGDLDHRRPLYPFVLEGAHLLRSGEPATELAGDSNDLDVFTRYWIDNLDVPHTVELANGATARLGPVKGFSMGGIASASEPSNIHATGEAEYGMSLDSVAGKPFLSFLARGAELAETLARRATGVSTEDFDAGPPAPPPDNALPAAIQRRIATLQDNRFSVERAHTFLQWCARERVQHFADTESVDLLILAEAYTRAVLARRESRGFFYRPDFPTIDPELDNQITHCRYDTDEDTVHVSLSPVGAAKV